jgi:hypothetical protein
VIFTGILHNYRFGMDRSISNKPMHRFDVEVLGTGLWLACQFTSQELDGLVMTANPPMDLFDGEAIEGMMVTVKRDAKQGRMIPISFGATTQATGPILLKDKKGKEVREGDKVSIRETNSYTVKSFTAMVVGYDAKTDTLTVRKSKQKRDTTVKKVKNLYRFELRSEGTPIPVLLSLGVDKDGNPILSGDLIQLFDNWSDGRDLGIATGQDSDFLIVTRTISDPVPGYKVDRSKTFKIVRGTPLGLDRDGRPVNSGDRVIIADSNAARSDPHPGYAISSSSDGERFQVIRDDRQRTDGAFFVAAIRFVEKVVA